MCTRRVEISYRTMTMLENYFSVILEPASDFEPRSMGGGRHSATTTSGNLFVFTSICICC